MRTLRVAGQLVLGIFLLAASPRALAQRCVPNVVWFDRQILTADNRLVLLETRVGSDYISFSYGGGRRLPLRVVRLGPAGELEQDSTFRLLWPEWKHHYAHQPNLALGRTQPILTPDTVGGLNWAYFSARNRSELGRERSHHWQDIRKLDSMETVWDLAIASSFRQDFSRWLPRLAEQAPVFPTGFVRNVHPRLYLDLQFPYLANARAASYRVVTEQRIDIPGEEAYLEATSTSQNGVSAPQWSWVLRSANWVLNLDGSLDPEAPLVTVGPDHRLYVTVAHGQILHCEPYYDIWPMVYCIDLRRGQVVWKRSTFRRSYVYN